MLFTKEMIEEIRDRLSRLGIKDTQIETLDQIHFPITGEETVVIVKNGRNVRITLNDLYSHFPDLSELIINLQKEGSTDIFNVSAYLDKSGATPYVTLEEAIASVPEDFRKIGLCITFANANNEWGIWQYTGTTLNSWSNVSNWRSTEATEPTEPEKEHNILPFDGFVTILNRNAISNQKYTSSSQVVAAEYTIVAERTINAAEKFYLKVEDTYYTNWEITTEIPITPVVGGDPLTTSEPGVISKSDWYYTEYRINKLFYNRSNKVIYAYEYSTTSLTPITNIQVVEENAPTPESTSNPDHATKGSIVVDLEHDKMLTWDGNKWKELSGGGSVDITALPNTLAIENGVLYLKNIKEGDSTIISQVQLPVPENGEDGQDGKSAYELALQENPEVGTLQQWLASLKGIDGINGTDGEDGSDGKSAFQIWKEENNTPNASVSEFLASLKESNFTSVAVQQLPETNIDTNKIYCLPDNVNNTWTENIYDGANWITLATHTGDLSGVLDNITDLNDDLQDLSDAFIAANVEDGGIYTDDSVSNSDWCHNKEFIPVTEGDVIRWRSGNAFSNNDDNRFNNTLCYYDSNFAKKNYFTYTQKDRVLSGSTEIVPADVAYIKASFRKEDGYGIDIKHAGESDFTTVFTVETANGKYKDIHKIPAMEELLNDINDNLYIKANVAPGGFVYNTGAVTNSNWCHCVDYIPVSPGDAVIWKAGNTILEGENRSNNSLIMYDANKQRIDYYGYKEVNRLFTVPADVSYIRASFPNEDGYSLEINGVTVFTTVATTKDKVQEAVNNAAEAKELAENISERLVDYGAVYKNIGYYLNTTGGLVSDANWGVSVDIPCEFGDELNIVTPSDITTLTSPQRNICFYNAQGEVLGYYKIYNRNQTLNGQTLTNLAYARTSIRLADADRFVIKINNSPVYTGVIVNSIDGNVYDRVREMIEEYAPTPEESGGSSDNHTSYMPLCGFENKTVDSNFNAIASSKAVCTSAIQIPYRGVCFNIKFPDAIKCKIQYGTITSNGMSSLISDVDTPRITTPFNDSTEIRFAFLKKDNSNITPEEIQALVDSGEISIGYDNHTPDVVQKNIACEPYTKAVMCKWIVDGQNTSYKNIPVFAHFSDLHGDVVRLKNIMEYCKYLGVDAVLNTGDTAQNRAINGMTTYHNIVGSYDIPTLLCVGNHDAWYDGDSRTGTQNEKLYTDIILPNSTKFGYTLPDAADYDDAATYYYRDFASQNIRVISVNLYEQNIGYWEYYGRISKKQIDWLIATLASTPAGYGVIIMTHTNTEKILIDSNHSEFFDVARPAPYDGSVDQQVKLTGDNSTGDPIVNIVDAFISGTSYSGSYTQAISGNTTETISYEADFTSLNSGVEFICYVSGHHHADFIGYLRNTANRQLALDVTTAQSLYGKSKAGDGDLIRGGQGATEDAFNVYGIDRVAGTVKIARVGANMTSRLTERKYMEIPYRDNS